MQINKKNAIKKEALRILKSSKPTKLEMKWFNKKVEQHVDSKNSDEIWVDNSW